MPAENQLTGKSCAGDPDGGWDSYVFGCVGGETAAVPTRSACPKYANRGKKHCVCLAEGTAICLMHKKSRAAEKNPSKISGGEKVPVRANVYS